MNPFSVCFMITHLLFGLTCYNTNSTIDYDTLQDFHNWRVHHNKTYTSENDLTCYFSNWINNRKYINQHNKKNLNYALELNKFADKDHHNCRHNHHYNKYMFDRVFENPVNFPEKKGLPDTVDWRTKGIVTDVKNQQQCGSCWAFSATGSMEAQHALKKGSLVAFSESQLIDCDKSDSGCNGGLMDDAFKYVISNGIETEITYPYIPHKEKCRYNASSVVGGFNGYIDVKGGESGLKEAVASVGPISVAIDASKIDFQFYKDGVYHNSDCSSTELDHGVLVVGYGTTNDGTDYWIVKNSWGTDWGNNGYISMARNKDNNCGIATQPSYPTL